MPIVQVEAQLSTDELLKAVSQLSQDELEQLAFQIIALRAQHQAPCLPQDEPNSYSKSTRDSRQNFGDATRN